VVTGVTARDPGYKYEEKIGRTGVIWHMYFVVVCSFFSRDHATFSRIVDDKAVDALGTAL
jgi:hypothetical protein